MSESETETGNDEPEETDAGDGDDLLEAQEGKGYGDDEGERDEALDDESDS
ncbi:MAG: hypothetical protein QOE36_1649 [Gaiellaceae bacterium]|nr:hypothetical protein [Gaiellaceae bacterium]